MVMGGDCYNYALLATGFVDVVVGAASSCTITRRWFRWSKGRGLISTGTAIRCTPDPTATCSRSATGRLEDVLEALGGS